MQALCQEHTLHCIQEWFAIIQPLRGQRQQQPAGLFSPLNTGKPHATPESDLGPFPCNLYLFIESQNNLDWKEPLEVT